MAAFMAEISEIIPSYVGEVITTALGTIPTLSSPDTSALTASGSTAMHMPWLSTSETI